TRPPGWHRRHPGGGRGWRRRRAEEERRGDRAWTDPGADAPGHVRPPPSGARIAFRNRLLFALTAGSPPFAATCCQEDVSAKVNNIRSWRTGLPIAEDIMLTPREFEDCYHNLDVILDDFETTTVDVYRYRNNDPKYNTDAYKEVNTVEAMKQKERLLGLMDAEIRKLRKIQLTKPKVEWKPRRQDASLQLDTSFLGSPAVFTQVLTQHTVSAATYSEVSRQAGLFPGLLGSLAMAEVLQRLRPVMMKVHSGKGSPEEIAVALHLVAKYEMYDKKFRDDSAQGVQDYCTRYIGLDCNGFVGNYAQAIGLSKRPNT